MTQQTAANPAKTAPLLERTPSAMTLALIAGLLNAWTFGSVQAFATVQSGNIVTFGYELVAGNWPRVAVVGISILAFALGSFVSMIGILLIARARRSYSATVLVVEAVVVVILGILAAVNGLPALGIAWIVSFLAGAQGNAFHREDGMLYGNVAVTFVVQSVGSLVAKAIGRGIADDHQPHMRPAGEYALVLLCFGVGGAVGFAVDLLFSSAAFFLAAIILVVLAIVAATWRGTVDPSGTAPTP